MSTLTDLKSLSSAEDFFSYLKLDFDPALLSPARLHILKRMGEHLGRVDLSGQDADVWTAARDTLSKAYADLASRGPLGARVFKVLQDHDPSRPPEAKGKGFFAFDDLLDEA